MNTKTPFLLAVALLLGAGMAFAKDEPASPVTIQFAEPENYTDFKTRSMSSDSDRAMLMRELTRSIERDVRRHIPAGYTVSLQIRDIDLAGDIDLYRAVSLNDVRIVRSIYPPRVRLEYTVTDASGATAASGEKRLTDSAFDWNLRLPNPDYTVHEQRLFSDFLRKLGRDLAQH